MKFSGNINLFERVGFLDKFLFTKHLAIMIRSGIPLSEALASIDMQTQNPAMKRVLKQVQKDVQNGQTLEKTLRKFPKVFDPFYLNLIRIGEESGNLEKNLDYIAGQLKKNNEFQRNIQSALLYPGIVLFIAFLAGSGISLFVLPQLTGLFTSLNISLPFPTRVLLFVAQLMKGYGYLVIGGIIMFGILFRIVIEYPPIKKHWHRALLSLPVLGSFFQDIQIAFFCRNLGIMLQSGLPILTALEVQYQATSNMVYKVYVAHILHNVEKGHSIGGTLAKAQFAYMPIIASKMIGVGEKTGKLDESLMYLGDFFTDEVDEYSKNFSTIIEPIMLIIIGFCVAFLALAIISPIYQLTGSIHP
ncbi:MAG: type II secretion system F family protein [Patescibacteria group bacterium]|nr:type II secretion system F family protein [Patescibacteria group bacterium]